MSAIQDPILKARSTPFEATVIKFVNLAISDYAPIVEKPEVYAEQEYDKKTKDELKRMRDELYIEASKMGLENKARGDYIKA